MKNKAVTAHLTNHMRSPFRYPGGKSWFVPYLRKWLDSKRGTVNTLIEPFAGGGVVSLTALMEGYVNRVIMCELDDDIAAVWQVILSDESEELNALIKDFQLNAASVEAILNEPITTRQKHAFRTIIKNRVSRGGIMAPGAGILKKGENDKGLLSRWYPDTLIKRIRAINAYKGSIEFIHGDGMALLEQYKTSNNVLFFVDPPYKTAGKRLYNHNELDHENLLKVCSELTGDFIITYEHCGDVVKMLLSNNLSHNKIGMRNTHLIKQNELIISPDLTWLGEKQLNLWT